MKILPDSLHALTHYKQFIVVKLTPTQHDSTKFIKQPVDYRTGKIANALDPTIWLDHTSAIGCAESLGVNHGVGFVLTEQDPFFFLDIDSKNCTEAGWSPLALEIVGGLPGASLELSSSGRGLHIIGKTGALRHRCRNTSLDIELYTSHRFIALTGIQAIGDASIDCTDNLKQIIEKYFYVDTRAKIVEKTKSSLDDDDIILRALNSVSGRGAFNENHATFADLWNANETQLAKAYPSPTGSTYNASSVDAALAQHLCFWTGGDETQIERLMFRSALYREKWDRKDYLPRTVRKACEKQTKFYKPTEVLNPISTLTEQNNADVTPDLLPEVSIDDIFLNPPQPLKFLIQELMPCGVLTLLGAHGGSGKSMLALQAAVCLAMGIPFLGKHTQKSRALFYSGEDGADVIRHRLIKICRQMGVNPHVLSKNLKIIDATDEPCLFVETYINGIKRGLPTPRYHQLQQEIARFEPAAVFIDNASDTFEGNENERPRVREFIRALVSLIKSQNAAIFLLAHIDKSTAKGNGKSEGYSGSTAWHNSARSRLFLSKIDDHMLLEQQKSNLGLICDPIHLQWSPDGVLSVMTVQAQQHITEIIALLIEEYYTRHEFISPNHAGKMGAYRVLRHDVRLPRWVDKEKLDVLLSQLEQNKKLYRELHTTETGKTIHIYKSNDVCNQVNEINTYVTHQFN